MAEKQMNDVRREEKTMTTGSIIQNHIKVQATKKIERDVPSTGGGKTKKYPGLEKVKQMKEPTIYYPEEDIQSQIPAGTDITAEATTGPDRKK